MFDIHKVMKDNKLKKLPGKEVLLMENYGNTQQKNMNDEDLD